MSAVKVLQWNAHGLLPRLEFKQHVAINNYDIICIQETFLNSSKTYSLPGYEIIRKDALISRVVE